jgi:hypothetical protein
VQLLELLLVQLPAGCLFPLAASAVSQLRLKVPEHHHQSSYKQMGKAKNSNS